MAWQPYRQYVATARKSRSKTKRVKDVRVGRRGRVRTVNVPKNKF